MLVCVVIVQHIKHTVHCISAFKKCEICLTNIILGPLYCFFFAYVAQLLSFVSFIYQAKWLTFKFEHMYPIKRLELVELQKNECRFFFLAYQVESTFFSIF